MRGIEAVRRNAVGIALIGSTAIGVLSLAAIGDGTLTANVATSIIPIVRLVEEPPLPAAVDISNTAFVNPQRDSEGLADAADSVPNYSLFHRNKIKDIIKAIRNGEDSTFIFEKLDELINLAHREMAIGALGFVGTSAVVEVATRP